MACRNNFRMITTRVKQVHISSTLGTSVRTVSINKMFTAGTTFGPLTHQSRGGLIQSHQRIAWVSRWIVNDGLTKPPVTGSRGTG